MMSDAVYQFSLKSPLVFFKAGECISQPGWTHAYTINDNGDYEIMIVTKGCIYLEINHQRYQVPAGNCILVPPYTTHFGYQATTTDSIHYWIHFFAKDTVTKLPLSTVPQERSQSTVYIPELFHLSDVTKLILPIRQLLNCLDQGYYSTHLLQANYFVSSIIIELNEQFLSGIIQPNLSDSNQRIEKICQWIRLHCNEQLTVQQVANKFDTSVSNLTRQMKKYRHISTIGFIHNCKIDLAQNMLLTSDKSVIEIASELGFSNVKYFMRLFKELTSTTPTQYRNSYTKEYVNNNFVHPKIHLPNDLS